MAGFERAAGGRQRSWSWTIAMGVSVVSFVACDRLAAPRTPPFVPNQATLAPARLLPGMVGHFAVDLFINRDTLYAAWLVPWRASEFTIGMFHSKDRGTTWAGGPLELPQYAFHGVDGFDRPFSFARDRGGRLYLAYSSSDGVWLALLDETGRVRDTVPVAADSRPFVYFRNPTLLIDPDGSMTVFYTKRKLEADRAGWPAAAASPSAVHWQRGVQQGLLWRESLAVGGTERRGYSVCVPGAVGARHGDLYLHCQGRLYRLSASGRRLRLVHWNIGSAHEIGESRLRGDGQGNLYVAWVRKHVTKSEMGIDGSGGEEGFSEICFTRSSDGELEWSRPVRVNDTALPFRWKSAPIGLTFPEYYRKHALQVTKMAKLLDFAVGEDRTTLAVLWRDWRNGEPHVYLSYSRDSGNTWSRNLQVDRGIRAVPTDASLVIGKDRSLFVLWLGRASDERQLPREVYFTAGRIGPQE